MLSNLMGKFSVIGVQELHGVDADLHRLQNEAPQGRLLGSPGPSAAVGGVLLWFGPKLVQLAHDFVHEVVVPGRLHYVDILLPDLVVRVANVHIQEISGLSKFDIVDSLSYILKFPFDGLLIVLGDFNATVYGEGRYNADKGLRHAASE